MLQVRGQPERVSEKVVGKNRERESDEKETHNHETLVHHRGELTRKAESEDSGDRNVAVSLTADHHEPSGGLVGFLTPLLQKETILFSSTRLFPKG